MLLVLPSFLHLHRRLCRVLCTHTHNNTQGDETSVNVHIASQTGRGNRQTPKQTLQTAVRPSVRHRPRRSSSQRDSMTSAAPAIISPSTPTVNSAGRRDLRPPWWFHRGTRSPSRCLVLPWRHHRLSISANRHRRPVPRSILIVPPQHSATNPATE